MLTLLLASCALVSQGGLPDVKDSLLLRFVQERAKLESGQLHVEVVFRKCEIYKHLEGERWTKDDWFRSDRSAFRQDSFKTRDTINEPNYGTRYAFDGTAYRLIHKTGDRRYSCQEFVKTKPGIVPGLTDPRIIGLYLESILAIHNFTLDRAARIATEALGFRTEKITGGTAEIYVVPKGAVYRYEFDGSGRPVRQIAENMQMRPPLRYEAEIGYPDTEARYPSTIRFKEFRDGELAGDEEWKITLTRVNEPLDLSLCTWQALAPEVGTSLSPEGSNISSGLSWDGKAFVPVSIQRFPGGPPGLTRQEREKHGWPLMPILGTIAVASAGLLVARWWLAGRRDAGKG